MIADSGRSAAETAGPPGACPVGGRHLAVLLEDWRTAGHGPLTRRLAHALRSRIASGLLPPGSLLPPERAVATVLGVSRSTVVGALDELRAGGFVESRQGSGTRVARSSDAGGDAAMTIAERLLLGGATLNLAASVPADASHLPELAIDVADLASVTPAHGYAPAGLPVLRDAIAARHCALGVVTDPYEVHVTNGAQHALDLVLGAVTKPGDTVAVEDPTYVGVRDLLEGRRLRALPLALEVVDAGGAGRIARLCRTARVAAVLLVPAVHSPTGRVRRRAVLRELATELDGLGRPVIEDNTVADLVFSGSRPPSLATWCERAPVLSVESTSKVAWGGLRAGWLRGPRELVERTVVARGRTDFGTSIASQLLALRLLERYDDLVDSRRVALARAAKHMCRLLRRHLPDWSFDVPGGGLSLWVDTGVDAEVLAEHALRYGVTVAPGSSAAVGEDARTHLRLCFDRPALELEAAIVRMRHAYEDARGWR